MDDELDTPGAFAAGGNVATDSSDGGDIPNLVADYSPSLADLLPDASTPISPIMDDSNDDNDSAYTGTTGSSSLSLQPLVNDLGTIGGSLVNAFVTAPANATTAEGLATSNFDISTAESSQLFTYLIIGLVIFLVFGFLDKKA